MLALIILGGLSLLADIIFIILTFSLTRNKLRAGEDSFVNFFVYVLIPYGFVFGYATGISLAVYVQTGWVLSRFDLMRPIKILNWLLQLFETKTPPLLGEEEEGEEENLEENPRKRGHVRSKEAGHNSNGMGSQGSMARMTSGDKSGHDRMKSRTKQLQFHKDVSILDILKHRETVNMFMSHLIKEFSYVPLSLSLNTPSIQFVL